MKETIAFPQLVELIAQKATTTSRMSELFLQELFVVISQELAEGKSVKINGLGTFKIQKTDTEKHVIFVPDKELAQAVNAPFAQFKPVELCETLTQEQLDEIDVSMSPKQEEPAQEKTEEIIAPAVEQDTEEVHTASEPGNAPAQPINEPAKVTPTVVDIPKEKNWKKWLLVGVAACAVIGLLAFWMWEKKPSRETRVVTAQTDSIKTPPPVVTDTMTGTNVLTLMAKKHYGDQAFWVYIARENQRQYPNYHKIPHGAVLVIPQPEKYGINSDSKKSIRIAYSEALKLRNEIKALESPATEEIAEDSSTSKQAEKKKARLQKKESGKKHYSRHGHRRSYRRR